MFSKKILCKSIVAAGCSLLVLSLGAKGDLRVEETSRITGGMMEGLSKVAGIFGAKGLNQNASTVYVKGDRMRSDTISDNELTHSEIIQLDREQIIDIDHKKKTYTVTTFAEKREQMEKALKRMQESKKEAKETKEAKAPDVKMEPKISIKDTGETKVINGFKTRHVILTMMMEVEDQKTKDKGAMGSDMDLWLTKDISGLDERQMFYQKYTQKMAYPELMKSAGISPGMAQDPRMTEAMQELGKQAGKMDGVAVLTVMSFNVSGTPSGQQPTQAEHKSEPARSSSNADAQEDVAKSLGKVLGGFGGFGRKKKKDETPQQSAPVESSTKSSSGTATANLMTMTTEMKSYSKASLSENLFDVPQGYKQKQK